MSSGNSAQSAIGSVRRHSWQILAAAATVVVGLGLAVGITALIVGAAHGPAPIKTETNASLPTLPNMAPDRATLANPSPLPSIFARRQPAQDAAPVQRPDPSSLADALTPSPQPQFQPQSQPQVQIPLPPPRITPAPPARPAAFASPSVSPSGPFDQMTAIYVLTKHTVIMPDGTQLEAHSGLGDLIDDPRHVDEKDRGATPPHMYDLTLRDGLFHGVQALRLNPVGGENAIFGRAGILAHPYMLGAKGDSNGCVSFKDYDAFLQAFQNGKVKRLAVVASLN
jgi:hypothetical protein